MEALTRLEEFLRDRYYNELAKAGKEEMAAVIDFTELDRFDILIADQLLEKPEEVIKLLNQAAKNVMGERVNVRVRNLPLSRVIRIRYLRAKHMGKLMQIDTIIKAASEVKPQIYQATYQCPACEKLIEMEQETSIVQKPWMCDCGYRGDFTLSEKKMFDTRWLVGVEPFELTTGERPGEISILLKEDMTSPRMQKKTDPGNRITVTGILKELPKRIKGKLATKMDTYIEAVHVEPSDIEFEELDISEEDEKKIKEMAGDAEIYEKLKASIAPGIYGFDEIKETLVLQLFGGVRHKLPDGSMIRGNIHVLITGDPSVGKSQLLKLVSSVVPRGRYVSGSGVSGAGLTATVVKNEAIGGWILEAGALILCNKGLIAIDEFDKMSRDDQIAMHEATSVETVSIAKASIVATLPAQTAVLAAANPKFGRFEMTRSLVEQIDIAETLLSRFDLKFALTDRPDKIQDEKLADHIIISRKHPEKIEPVIGTNILRKYIAYAKKIDDVELSDEAAAAMKDFYVDMRNRYSTAETNVISITLRQYEALLRLAEASAKIRLDRTARMEDAERAIRLMKYSLMQLGYDVETGRIDIDKLESGITASKRRRIAAVLDIIEALQRETGKGVAVDDVLAEAQNQGLTGIEDIIEELIRQGSIFEPRAGFVRKL